MALPEQSTQRTASPIRGRERRRGHHPAKPTSKSNDRVIIEDMVQPRSILQQKRNAMQCNVKTSRPLSLARISPILLSVEEGIPPSLNHANRMAMAFRYSMSQDKEIVTVTIWARQGNRSQGNLKTKPSTRFSFQCIGTGNTMASRFGSSLEHHTPTRAAMAGVVSPKQHPS